MRVYFLLMKKRHLLGSALVLLTAAQSVSAQTTRTVQPLMGVPEVQAEWVLHNGDYLLLGVGGRRVFDNYSPAPPRALGFDDLRLNLGYEHFWQKGWSIGGTLRAVNFHDKIAVVPQVLLRHRSQLGGLTFGQRLAVERTLGNTNSFVYGSGPEGENWIRLRADLEKRYPLGPIALRPRLSYEAATHMRLQKGTNDSDERTIQFTSLRGEVGLRLSNRFDLTPWFAYQTRYSTTIQLFNQQGQPTSGTRLNQVDPTIGLDVRFTFFAGKAAFERQQLPTQH